MALFQSFNYCEVANNFSVLGLTIAQPANVVSNIPFFLASYFILKDSNKTEAQKLAAYLIALVGVTSTLWHLSLDPLALVKDSVAVFTFAAFICYHSSFVKNSSSKVILVYLFGFLVGSLSIGYFLKETIPLFSAAFFPSLLLLLVFPAAISKEAPYIVRRAGLFFGAALFCRLADVPLCALLSLGQNGQFTGYSPGLHWLWHLLSACTAYLLIQALHPLFPTKQAW